MSFNKVALTATLLAGLSAASLNANANNASAEVTLQGVITATTCDVTVNGGKSVLNVGTYPSASFVANQKLGSVNMPVTLTGCDAAEEKGSLIVQGLTSIANNNQNIFVSKDSDKVGFMVALANDTVIKSGEGAPVTVATDATGANYSFKVGMGSTTGTPEPGAYSAPILVAYIVN
ncbi:fimbrial protein [Providencia sneebia]|uniref:Putative fimbrial-like protein n=1 Tax=Providencia sneebia DSM 19967 TaxID=1141660 RepID=K8WHV8_9GAMM|nr:fimbrial-like protein [Providencia sneebia]EKT60163.1 putative fimbrial-like protein [Providencia sneebia DSM 19967]